MKAEATLGSVKQSVEVKSDNSMNTQNTMRNKNKARVKYKEIERKRTSPIARKTRFTREGVCAGEDKTSNVLLLRLRRHLTHHAEFRVRQRHTHKAFAFHKDQRLVLEHQGFPLKTMKRMIPRDYLISSETH